MIHNFNPDHWKDCRNTVTTIELVSFPRSYTVKRHPLQCEFHVEMCSVERWRVRTLRKQIDSMLFEHTAISRKPEEVIRHELAALREQDKVSSELDI